MSLARGITTSCTYADSETVTMEVSDCVQLVEAAAGPRGQPFGPAPVSTRK